MKEYKTNFSNWVGEIQLTSDKTNNSENRKIKLLIRVYHHKQNHRNDISGSHSRWEGLWVRNCSILTDFNGVWIFISFKDQHIQIRMIFTLGKIPFNFFKIKFSYSRETWRFPVHHLYQFEFVLSSCWKSWEKLYGTLHFASLLTVVFSWAK